jgi:hypothetical protein
MATNLYNLTRDLIEKSLTNEVYVRTAFLDDLNKRKRITAGGRTLQFPVIKDTLESLAQAYSMKEPLTSSQKSITEIASFEWRYIQLPIEYDGDVEVQNLNAAGEEKIYDVAEMLAQQALYGIDSKLQTMMFANGVAPASTTDYATSGKSFGSIPNALNHDEAYGGLTRTLASASAGTNDWWQSADPAAGKWFGSTLTASTQDTAANLSIANLRAWTIKIQRFMKKKGDIQWTMCPTLFNKLKAECQAQMIYQGATDTANVGFNKMFIDGMQIVDADYMETTAVSRAWVLGLNLETWELHFNKARNFKMTPFKWQGDQINGTDTYLSRILVAGNLVCKQPNANMWLTNVS